MYYDVLYFDEDGEDVVEEQYYTSEEMGRRIGDFMLANGTRVLQVIINIVG